MRYVIGLTGGIACGKSAVSRVLSGLGAGIIDADQVGHEILSAGQAAYAQVVQAFGEQILNAQGEIDRKRLGAIVFAEEKKLLQLNSITHPHIINNIVKQIEAGNGIMVLDAALLFETGLDALCDEIWLVMAKREEQIRRILLRDHLTRQEAERRIQSQGDYAQKRGKAKHIIDNSGSAWELEREVKCLYQQAEQICVEKRKRF